MISAICNKSNIEKVIHNRSLRRYIDYSENCKELISNKSDSVTSLRLSGADPDSEDDKKFIERLSKSFTQSRTPLKRFYDIRIPPKPHHKLEIIKDKKAILFKRPQTSSCQSFREIEGKSLRKLLNKQRKDSVITAKSRRMAIEKSKQAILLTDSRHSDQVRSLNKGIFPPSKTQML